MSVSLNSIRNLYELSYSPSVCARPPFNVQLINYDTKSCTCQLNDTKYTIYGFIRPDACSKPLLSNVIISLLQYDIFIDDQSNRPLIKIYKCGIVTNQYNTILGKPASVYTLPKLPFNTSQQATSQSSNDINAQLNQLHNATTTHNTNEPPHNSNTTTRQLPQYVML